jgi:hypothetical protein
MEHEILSDKDYVWAGPMLGVVLALILIITFSLPPLRIVNTKQLSIDQEIRRCWSKGQVAVVYPQTPDYVNAVSCVQPTSSLVKEE